MNIDRQIQAAFRAADMMQNMGMFFPFALEFTEGLPKHIVEPSPLSVTADSKETEQVFLVSVLKHRPKNMAVMMPIVSVLARRDVQVSSEDPEISAALSGTKPKMAIFCVFLQGDTMRTFLYGATDAPGILELDNDDYADQTKINWKKVQKFMKGAQVWPSFESKSGDLAKIIFSDKTPEEKQNLIEALIDSYDALDIPPTE